MAGGLITLPLRLGVRAASLSLRVTEEVVGRTLSIATRVVGGATESEPASERPSPPPRETQRSTERPGTNGASEIVAPEPRDPEADAAAAVENAPAAPVVVEEPSGGPEGLFADTTHVSEEPVVVEEVADPGVEDGAGAQIHIEEPWDGYRRMHASEVIARIDTATAAELAAVNLYESAHQARQTVLQAVERQLEKVSRGGASD